MTAAMRFPALERWRLLVLAQAEYSGLEELAKWELTQLFCELDGDDVGAMIASATAYGAWRQLHAA